MDFSAQGRQGWIVILGLLLMAGGALAQSRTAPVDSSAWNERLEIGPVEGLTTAWHRAPRSTAVPLGTTVELRVRASWSAPVVWSGAREVRRDAGFSIAEVQLDRTGPHPVRVEISDLREAGYRETVHFEVVDLGGGPVQVKDLRLVADEVVVDPERPNASSMQYFFRGGSIAELSEDVPGYYVTSTKRWVTAVAKVEPAGFAPLLEWRLDGEPLAQLGAQVRLQSFVAREHLLEAGAEGLTLETYRVHITSHESRTQIPDGVPVTFSARTEPPGYEERITWLASTKTGTCTPAMGEGAEFTVRFEGTTGASGRWLGVRSDQATSSADSQGSLDVGPFDCPSLNKGESSVTIGPCLVNPDFDCDALSPTADLPVDLGNIECQVSNQAYFCTCNASPGSFPACDGFIAQCAFAGGEVSGNSADATCGGTFEPEPAPPSPPAPPVTP